MVYSWGAPVPVVQLPLRRSTGITETFQNAMSHKIEHARLEVFMHLVFQARVSVMQQRNHKTPEWTWELVIIQINWISS